MLLAAAPPPGDEGAARAAVARVHAAVVDNGLWSPRCDPSLRWTVPLVSVHLPNAIPDAVTCPACRAALSAVSGEHREPGIRVAARLNLTDDELEHLRECDPWKEPCGRCGRRPAGEHREAEDGQ